MNNRDSNPKPNNGQGNLNKMKVLINKIMNINAKVKNYPHIQTNFQQQLLKVMEKTTKEVDSLIERRNILKARANQIVRSRNYKRYIGFSDKEIADKLGITPFKSVKQYITPRNWKEEMKFAINNAVSAYYPENTQIDQMYNLIKNQAKNGEVLNEKQIRNSITSIIRTTKSHNNQQNKLMNLLKKTSKR